VWCPGYRRGVLGGRVAARVRGLIGRKATGRGWEVIAVGVMPDRVRLLVGHEPTASASCVANRFRGYPLGVLREELRHLRSRVPTLWSSSLFVASVGVVGADTVRRCVDTRWERSWVKRGKGGRLRRGCGFLLRPASRRARAVSELLGGSLLAL
jgi:putative transposase